MSINTTYSVYGSNPSGVESAFHYQAAESQINYYEATFQGDLELTMNITLADTTALELGLEALSAAALLAAEVPLNLSIAPLLLTVSATSLYLIAQLLEQGNTQTFSPSMTVQLTFTGLLPLTQASPTQSSAVMMTNGDAIILTTASPPYPIISSTNYSGLMNQLNGDSDTSTLNISPYFIPFILKTPPIDVPAYVPPSTSAMSYNNLYAPTKTVTTYANIYASDYNAAATAFQTPSGTVTGNQSLPIKTVGGVITYTTPNKWCYFQVSNPTGNMIFNITLVGGGGASKGSSDNDECGVGGGGGGEVTTINVKLPTGSYYIYVGGGAIDDHEITDPITGNNSYYGGNTYFAYLDGSTYTSLFTAKGGYSKEGSGTGGGYGYDSDGNLESDANKGFSYGGDGGADASSGRDGGNGGDSPYPHIQIESVSMGQTVNLYCAGGGGGGSAAYNGQSDSSKYGHGGAGAGGSGE